MLRPKRTAVALVGVSLCALTALSARLAAQTSPFLCSGGSRDGQSCMSFTDCPSGVCVIAQGICQGTDLADVSVCDCAGGTCGGSTCSADTTTCTCIGGGFAGVSCDPTTNCNAGVACAGTQKVCLGGSDASVSPPISLQGFSCLNSAQCGGASCASTGMVCSGGDFDGFACVNDSNCTGTSPTPNGLCEGAGATPTATVPPTAGTPAPTPSGPTATPTRTTTAAAPTTPVPTLTPTPPAGTTTPTVARERIIEVFSSGGGCSISGRADGAAPLWLLATALAAVRRRARRRA